MTRLHLALAALVVFAVAVAPVVRLVTAVFSDRENWDESVRWP